MVFVNHPSRDAKLAHPTSSRHRATSAKCTGTCDFFRLNVPEHVTFFDFLTIPQVKKSQVEKSNE